MPSRWQSATFLSENYDIELAVIAPPLAKINKVYDSSGYLSPATAGLESLPKSVTLVPLRNTESPPMGFSSRKLKAALDTLNPDVIWVHGEPLNRDTSLICNWYAKRRETRIYQSAVENRFTSRNIVRQFSRWFSLRRVDGFLAVAGPTEEALVKGLRLPKRKVHVTYLPNIPAVLKEKSESDRRDLSSPRLGFAGRLEHRKGINVLLDAFNRMPSNTRLYIAGDGDADIVGRLRENERIQYMGLLSDLSELLSKIHILIVPSQTVRGWREQFGRVIAEAFSCGIPVVGSDSGAIPDVVGSGGLIFHEKSPDELLERMRCICANKELYEQLSTRAKARFESHFSVEAHARCLARVFGIEHLDSRK